MPSISASGLLKEALTEDAYAHVKGNLWSCDANALDYADVRDRLTFECDVVKKAVSISKETKPKREHKKMDAAAEIFTQKIQEILLAIQEHSWLTDKFGAGEYAGLGIGKRPVQIKNYGIVKHKKTSFRKRIGRMILYLDRA